MSSTAEKNPQELPQKTPTIDDFFFHAADYIYKRKKFFTILAISVISLLLIGYGISWYLQYQDEKRDTELFQIEQIIQDKELKKTEKFSKALPLLNSFIDQNSGSDQVRIAIFQRANLYSSNGKLKEAEGDLQRLLSSSTKGEGFYVLISIYLANTLRDQGLDEQAVEVLQNAQSEVMTDVVLMELAEMYISQEKKTEAKQNLDALIKDFPTSLYQERAKRMLEQLSL